MDEKNYRIARDEIVSISCAFEKSILSQRVVCSQASKKNIAEREVIQCASTDYQLRCKSWLSLLRKKSLFALQLTDGSCTEQVLPHAKEMKVQVGGINGLVLLLEKKGSRVSESEKMNDLHDVNFILSTCGGQFEEIPFEQLVKSVAQFQLR